MPAKRQYANDFMDPYNLLDARKRLTDTIEWSVEPPTQRQEIVVMMHSRPKMTPIKPVYPMCFPETINPEVVREDVRNALIDALAIERYTLPAEAYAYSFEDWAALGMSDPVTLPPLELEF